MQVPVWEPTNRRHPCTKFTCPGNLDSGFVHPLSKIYNSERNLCNLIHNIMLNPLKNEQCEITFFSSAFWCPKETKPAFFEDSQASPVCRSGVSSCKIKIGMQHWCDDTDRRNIKYSQEILSQCHFVHHNFHKMEAGCPLWDAAD